MHPCSGTFLILIISNDCLLQDGSGSKAGGTDGDGEGAKPGKSGNKAPIQEEKEQPAESSESEERDSVEEEDSEDDDERASNDRNGTTDRRRSSLTVWKSLRACCFIAFQPMFVHAPLTL